jgi:hypothetical protein
VTTTAARFLLWSPRVLGILVSVFVGMFALDSFSEGKPFTGALSDFAIHLTPAVLLLGIVLASWRWQWIGGIAFVALAAGYAAAVGGQLDWILVISGPLLIVGALFLWSWRFHESLHTPGA